MTSSFFYFQQVFALLAAGVFAGSTSFAQEPPAVLPAKHQALLKEHCLSCHDAEKQKGKFRVDQLPFSITDNLNAERWQKVLNALNSGEMPPDDQKQLPSGAKADFLEDLAQVMVVARRNLGDTKGAIVMRRLNQREYGNTLRELLGVRMNVNELPNDKNASGFDTAGTSLFMSGDQLEQYLDLAREAVSESFERHDQAGLVKKERFEAEKGLLERVSKSLKQRIDARVAYNKWTRAVDKAAALPQNQTATAAVRDAVKGKSAHLFYDSWAKISGAPSPEEYGFKDAQDATFAASDGRWNRNVPYQSWFLSQPENQTGAWLTVGDNQVNSYFSFNVNGWPAGDYVVRLRAAASDKVLPERRFIEFGMGGGNPFSHDSTRMVTGTLAEPQIIEIPVSLTSKGLRTFFVRERGTHDNDNQPNIKQNVGIQENGVGLEFAIWIDWAEVERLPAKPPAPGMKALASVVGDAKSVLPPAELGKALENFCLEAFRGHTPSPAFLKRLLNVYDDRRSQGGNHRQALTETLALVLSSPRFLYLSEPSGALAGAGTPAPSEPLAPSQNQSSAGGNLSARDLGTRLSYFLWSAPPDHELRDLAATGALLHPEVLSAQIGRLLDDPRSGDFLRPFLHQWLRMDRLDFFRFNNVLFPDFDESTKEAARMEVYETFAHVLRKNRSLRELLKSDYAVVNGVLAQYYKLPGVRGDDFQVVNLPADSPRGGLLGMAAIHGMGSNGEHSSPIERGAWVLRKLLNDPPPPAPANVPQLSRLEGKVLTTRERLVAHQEQPQCASCHRKIDPIGFGLENFDAVGQWRTEDSYERPGQARKTWAVEPAGVFHKGPSFASYHELRDLIQARTEDFSRAFSTALLQYALGRPVSFSDETLVERMVSEAKTQDFALRSFILTLVRSDAFHSK
jgi:mono/diheme cytochrome c family protein